MKAGLVMGKISIKKVISPKKIISMFCAFKTLELGVAFFVDLLVVDYHDTQLDEIADSLRKEQKVNSDYRFWR